jgi:hypothetical protein
MIYPNSWDKWIELDIEYFKICDGYFRIPDSDDSRGANIEQETAGNLGIKIFEKLSDISLIQT